MEVSRDIADGQIAGEIAMLLPARAPIVGSMDSSVSERRRRPRYRSRPRIFAPDRGHVEEPERGRPRARNGWKLGANFNVALSHGSRGMAVREC